MEIFANRMMVGDFMGFVEDIGGEWRMDGDMQI